MAWFNQTLGRWMIRVDGRQMYRYRAVMEEHLGRELRTDEIVHHVNGDATDDRIENLRLMTQGEHMRLHHPELAIAQGAAFGGKWSGQADACVECGTTEREHEGRGLCTRCYAAWTRERQAGRFELVCEGCGKSFTRHVRGRFCSTACSGPAGARARWAKAKAAV